MGFNRPRNFRFPRLRPAMGRRFHLAGYLGSRCPDLHLRLPLSLEKPGDLPGRHVKPPIGSTLALWVAQGLGVGRVPVAPGTFGSVLGMGWFALLVASGSLWLVAAGCITGAALSVWLCG